MKICYVTPLYPDLASRPRGTFIKELVRTIVERGHDAVVVVPRIYGDVPEFEEIRHDNGHYERIYRFNFGSEDRPLATYDRIPVRMMLRYFASGYRCVRKVLHGEKPDVVHAHFAVPVGPIAALACRKEKIPWLLSVYGTELTWSGSPLARIPGKFACSRAPAVIGCSQYACETAIKFGARPEVCHVTYIGGVDTTKFSPEVSSEGVRERYGVPQDAALVLFIGNLVNRKRIADMLRAMPNVLADVPEAALFIAGEGPLRNELTNLIEELHIGDRVSMPGAIPHDDLPGLLSACDAFVLPSAEEGMGMVLLEAMSAGKPVVASRNSGILSVIDEEDNGLLFETKNVEALVAAVARVLTDRALAARLGHNARHKAVDRFDRNRQADDLMRLYEVATQSGR